VVKRRTARIGATGQESEPRHGMAIIQDLVQFQDEPPRFQRLCWTGRNLPRFAVFDNWFSIMSPVVLPPRLWAPVKEVDFVSSVPYVSMACPSGKTTNEFSARQFPSRQEGVQVEVGRDERIPQDGLAVALG